MVSFSNTDGAHYDSVNGQSTVPSKPIQLDEKIPVQSSNFAPQQMGALPGASVFMKQNKNHNYQYKYTTKSIPSPAPIFKEPAQKAVFCFWHSGSVEH